MGVTCSQSGSLVTLTVTGVNTNIQDLLTQTYSGTPMPVNRRIAAIIHMRVFVPFEDIKNEADVNTPTGYFRKNINNVATDFNPVGISGTSNFNGLGESPEDNDVSSAPYFYESGGSTGAGKFYYRGWSDVASEQTLWGGGSWTQTVPNGSNRNTGDGQINPDQTWGATNYQYNSSVSVDDYLNAATCDVIDASVMTYDPIADPGPYVNSNLRPNGTEVHAVDLSYSSTESLLPTLKYGTGYEGPWPPDPFDYVASRARVIEECAADGTGTTQWFDSLDAALASGTGPVTKIKVEATQPINQSSLDSTSIHVLNTVR